MMNSLLRKFRRPPAAQPTPVATTKHEPVTVDDRVLGLKHEHQWRTMTTRSELQSAHDSMRWDTAKSRLLSVDACTRCNEFDRGSAVECTESGCSSHPICERPYR